MKSYENVLIFTPTLSDEEVSTLIRNHRKSLQSFGAAIVHEDFWGLRQLAYPIQKKTTGIYLITEFSGQDDVVAKIEVLYKRNEKILRFMTTRLDKHAVEYNEKKRNGLIGKKRKKQDQAEDNNSVEPETEKEA